MNFLYSTFAVLCTFTINNSICGAVAPKVGLEIAKGGIETLDKALDLYNEIFDKIVPWSELNKTIGELDKYSLDYSIEAAELTREIKTKMLDGMDAYFRATQSIYEWCGLTIPLLTTYSKLFTGPMNQGKFNTQRALLLKLLRNGIDKMSKAQQELGDSSSSFNVAAGKLTSLNHRLEADFNEGKLIPEIKAKMASIEKFYNELTQDVSKSFENIDETNAKLKGEIRVIGDLAGQTEESKIYVELDNTNELKEIILELVTKLVAKCKDYRTRHISE